MGKANNDLMVTNENLFRALINAPVGIFFSIFAAKYAMTDGLMLFKVIFVIMAVYFSLSALAYAAYYTNDVEEGNADPVISNKHLIKILYNAPLAIIFSLITLNSIATSASLFFTVLYVLLATYFVLSTLAYSAFYTNDRYESASAH